MAFQIPNSMDECLYFTRRSLDNDGKIMAWVERKLCTKCGKAKMGKPVVKGAVKIRAKEYQCPECKYTEDKAVHEESCTVKVIYTCPFCKNQGEATTPYKLRAFEGTKAFVFECGKCKKKIPVTKKMKDPKSKNSDADADED